MSTENGNPARGTRKPYLDYDAEREKEVKENNDKRFQRIVVGNYRSNLYDERVTTEQNREYLVLNDIVYFLVEELTKVRDYVEYRIIDDEEEKKKVFSELMEIRKSLNNVTQVTHKKIGETK